MIEGKLRHLNMVRRLGHIGIGSCAAFLFLLINGCNWNVANGDPDELFQNVLNRLSTDEYVIQQEDLGSVISQRSMNSNWNPLENTKKFQEGTKAITIDQEQSNQQMVVLSATLDNPLAKQALLDQLRDQMNVIRTDDPYIQSSGGFALSKEEIVAMNKEIQAYIEQADHQLLERLDTSTVNSTMLIWIERKSEKPVKVQFKTIIDDTTKDQTESVIHSYLIS